MHFSRGFFPLFLSLRKFQEIDAAVNPDASPFIDLVKRNAAILYLADFAQISLNVPSHIEDGGINGNLDPQWHNIESGMGELE